MNGKNKISTVKVDEPTKEKLKGFKRQLSAIENDDIALGEIIKRMTKGDDILQRLKLGSLERRGK